MSLWVDVSVVVVELLYVEVVLSVAVSVLVDVSVVVGVFTGVWVTLDALLV